MSESSSTLNTPFRGVVNEEGFVEVSPTGSFLSPEEDGPAELLERAERRRTVVEDSSAALHVTSASSVEKDSSSAKPHRVFQTRWFQSLPDQRYILLKKYEGFVTTRDEVSFAARLFENNSDYPVVEAEFDLEELSEVDRDLAIEGAPLVWTIGYSYEGSTRKRESRIYLRRLSPWGRKELEEGRSAAEDLTRDIRWE